MNRRMTLAKAQVAQYDSAAAGSNAATKPDFKAALADALATVRTLRAERDGAVDHLNAVQRDLVIVADERDSLAARNAELEAALRLVRDYVVTMKGHGHQYQIEIDAALNLNKGPRS